VGRTPLPLGRVTRGLLPLPITNTLLIRVANLQHREHTMRQQRQHPSTHSFKHDKRMSIAAAARPATSQATATNQSTQRGPSNSINSHLFCCNDFR
jgi:hypothetical protein